MSETGLPPVIAGKWHSVGGSVVPEAKGQGGVGEHWGALRGALGHRREGPLCAHPRWEPAHAATKLQSEHSTTQVKTLNMEKCFPTLGYF